MVHGVFASAPSRGARGEAAAAARGGARAPGIQAVACSPNGARLAVADASGSLSTFDLRHFGPASLPDAAPPAAGGGPAAGRGRGQWSAPLEWGAPRCVARPLHDRFTTVARPLHDRCTTVARPLHDRCTRGAEAPRDPWTERPPLRLAAPDARAGLAG